MPTTLPKFRRPLNNYQTTLLQTLYKFRFATARLIAEAQGAKHERVILARLRILVDQQYIGQKYDSSYKIKGKPATYHLLPKGIRYLRQQSYANPKVLKSLYYDKKADDKRIAHCLNVFAIYNQLKWQQPDTFWFYSSSELRDKPNLPRPLPDARVRRVKPSKTLPNDYFLICIEDGSYWLHRRKVRSLFEYAESERWQKATKRPFPTILIVCETKALQNRLLRLTERELETTYIDLQCLVTTKDTPLSKSLS